MLSTLKQIMNKNNLSSDSCKDELDKLNVRLQEGESLGSIIREAKVIHSIYPDQDSPYHFLAYCYEKKSDLKAAEDTLIDAIKINKHNPQNWDKLGLIRLRNSDIEKADQAFEKAIKLDKNNAYFHHHRGLTLAELGWNLRAARSQQHAVKIKMDFPEAHNALGIVYSNEKQYKQAITAFKFAIKYKPDMHEAWRNLALANLKANRKEEALKVLEQATKSNPEKSELVKYHAWLLRKLHKPQESVIILEELLSKQKPKYDIDSMLLFDLAESYLHAEEYFKAEEYCQQGLALSPQSAHGLSLLGTIYLNLQWADQALDAYKKAIDITPDDDFLMSKIGLTLNILGQHEEAKELYNQGLKQNAANTHIISQLTSYQKMTKNDLWLVAHIEKVLPEINDSNDKVRLFFSLGKIYDDLEEYDKAFKFYKKGNDLKFYRFNYDEKNIKKSVDQIIEYFSVHKQKPDNLPTSESEQPIFIIGMPRSGTSLVEQILASHPKVTGAGELSLLPRKLRTLCREKNANYPNVLDQVSNKECQDLIDYYLNESREHVSRSINALSHNHSTNTDINISTTKHITDKLPYNFFNIGLIHWLYPNAKIIHTKRNPLDTCLSCYFQNFTSANEHTFNLDTLAEYYLQYIRLMKFWKEMIPEKIIEIEYEKLVSDQATKTKSLIKQLNMEWDERCLNFHDTNRSVQTASAWQVRQKIYDSSTARWRNYEKHLESVHQYLQ